MNDRIDRNDTELQTVQQRSLAKGLLAGLIGGLAATAAKTLAEKVYPPRVAGQPEPPAALAERFAGHPLAGAAKTLASESIHWSFGALAGAAYGALAEFYPPATAKAGATFGLALETITHETALPSIGLAAEPQDQTARERASEMGTHVVFGVVTEFVRKRVRNLL